MQVLENISMEKVEESRDWNERSFAKEMFDLTDDWIS